MVDTSFPNGATAMPRMVQCGSDTSVIDDFYCHTGFYNIENADTEHKLPDGSAFYRVIVLGDHQMTPTGYTTEIAIGYDNGRNRIPYMRTSTNKDWKDWQKITEIV